MTNPKKQRYHFALSSFSRLYGIHIVSDHNVKQFCLDWSKLEENAPLEGLNEVDKYFVNLYNRWKENDFSFG
jgi:hypothetical protein